MIRLLPVFMLLLVAPAPSMAVDLFAATGAWQGEGRLATGPEAPLVRGRCRVEITPDPGAGALDLVGRCAVAAGMSDISVKLVRTPGGAVRAGVWSAATGQTVQYAGAESGAKIALTAAAPLDLDGRIYESRVEVTAPDGPSFAVRQLLRASGETAWRVVAEMTYRPAGG